MSGLTHTPDVIIAADWSVDPRKRWRSTIVRAGERWRLHAAEEVGNGLLRDVLAQAGAEGRSLVGFDFPIGVPAAYASLAKVDCFRTLLAGVGRAPPWDRFWEAVDPRDAPSVHQPLYPSRNGVKGSVKKAALAAGVGVSSFDTLKRRVDRDQNAECMFWALGAKQVGKACLSGWREELQPALGAVRLWPFDGVLPALLEAPGVVVAEIYPAASMRRLGLRLDGKKSDCDARRRAAGALRAAADALGCAVERDAVSQIETGFALGGDDAFDACVAALAMLDVVTLYAREDEPPDDAARTTEGWILGVNAQRNTG